MKDNIIWTVVTVLIVLILALSLRAPCVLSDQNSLLRDFIDGQIVGIEGIIVTIALGSMNVLIVELNKIEEKFKTTRAFAKAKKSVRQTSFLLVLSFLLSIITVFLIKGNFGGSVFAQSFLNGLNLIFLLLQVIVLYSVTIAVISIPANLRR